MNTLGECLYTGRPNLGRQAGQPGEGEVKMNNERLRKEELEWGK